MSSIDCVRLIEVPDQSLKVTNAKTTKIFIFNIEWIFVLK